MEQSGAAFSQPRDPVRKGIGPTDEAHSKCDSPSHTGSRRASPATAHLSQLPDEKLIEALRTGQARAFDVLYLRYQSKVISYLSGMIANYCLAEDVYNDVMYSVFKRLPDGIEPAHYRRYLFRAAHNACLNAGRREKNAGRRPEPEQLDEMGWTSSKTQFTPEEHLSGDQLYSMTQRMLETLPEEQRSALLLFHNQGLSYNEIADVLERPLGTVRWLIHQARTTMAKQLAKFDK